MASYYHERDGSSDDEFPDLDSLAGWSGKGHTRLNTPSTTLEKGPKSNPRLTTGTPTLQRRKLGQVTDNVLLRSLGNQASTPVPSSLAELGENNKKSRPRVQLRTRQQSRPVKTMPVAESSDSFSEKEEITFVTEASADDSSEFQGSLTSDSEDEDEASLGEPPSAPRRRALQIRNRKIAPSPPDVSQSPTIVFPSPLRQKGSKDSTDQGETGEGVTWRTVDNHLQDAISKLHL